MSLKLISRVEPVIALESLRRQCKLDAEIKPGNTVATHEDDGLLLDYLAGAVELAEHQTERAVGTQSLELALDMFPLNAIALPKGPAVSVQAVTYRDEFGVVQTVDPSGYVLDNRGDQNWLLPAFGVRWPAAQLSANSLVVRYTAGGELPRAIKLALLLLVADMYKNPEATSDKQLQVLPIGVKALLNTQRIWGL